MTTTTRPPFSSVLLHLPAVDEALPKLLNHLEDLQVAVLNNEDRPVLEIHFRLVGSLAIQTFRREEEAMDLCRDRNALPHKSAHQMFLKLFLHIRAVCLEQGPTVALAQDIRTDLVGWLSDHHRLFNASLGRTVRDMIERSRAHHQATGCGSSAASSPGSPATGD
jgi:hemerythrin